MPESDGAPRLEFELWIYAGRRRGYAGCGVVLEGDSGQRSVVDAEGGVGSNAGPRIAKEPGGEEDGHGGG